jgi:hypothetical protein
MEKERAEEVTEELQELFDKKAFAFGGVKSWHRHDESPYFRAEWREEGDDLVYNFYHADGPDMQKGFDDPDSEIDQGEDASLSEEVAQLIEAVVKAVIGDNVRYEMEYIPEALCWQLKLLGRATNIMARDLYTKGLFDTIHANIPQLYS